MSGKDFIPGPDGDFDTFFKAFFAAVTGNPTGFGLAPADVTLITTAHTTWIAAYPAHQTAQLQAHQASETKAKARDEAETAARSITKKINGNPAVDNQMRANAALPPHDLVKSAIGAPTTRPIGRLEGRGHLMLVLHVADETSPQRDAKPHGVHACEIRIHIGDPAPADETGYTFLAHTTRTPYVDQHPATDAGKTAYYMIRWLNAKLEPGPWGDVVSAKIPL